MAGSGRRSLGLGMGTGPEALKAEQAALSAEIDAAFATVRRVGGVSWNESVVRDNYGSESECLQARESDGDRHWSELVDDRRWEPDCGIGGFSFLDAIGFRYYLPAAMKRSLASGGDEGIQFHLTYREDKLAPWRSEKHSLLNDRQRRCIARFLRYMIEFARAREWLLDAGYWQEALDSHWRAFLADD